MATGVFSGYLEGIMSATPVNLLTGNLGLVLWPSAAPATATQFDTTANNSTETAFGTSVGDAAEVEASHRALTAAITSRTVGSVGNGIFDSGATTTFTAAVAGVAESKDLLLYHYTGDGSTLATNFPVAYFDLTTPVTPNGQDIIVTWSAGGIMQIT